MLLKILALFALFIGFFIIYAIHLRNEQKDAHFFNLGNHFASQKSYDKAIMNHLKALQLRKMKYAGNDKKIIKSHNNLATIYAYRKDYDKAIEHYSEAMTLRHTWKEQNNEEFQLFAFDNLSKIGLCYFQKVDYEGGLQSYGQALGLPIVEDLHNKTFPLIQAIHDGHKPTSQDFDGVHLNSAEVKLADSVIVALQQVVAGYEKLGESMGAVTITEKSAELQWVMTGYTESAFFKDEMTVAEISSQIALQYSQLEDSEGAVRNYNRALEISKKTRGNTVQIGSLNYNIGQIYSDASQFESSKKYLLDALKDFKEGKLDPAHQYWSMLYSALGYCYYRLQDFDNAIKYYQEENEAKANSSNFQDASKPEQQEAMAGSYFNLGNVYLANNKADLALENFNKAIEIWETSPLGLSNPHLAAAYAQIAVALVSGGQEEKALQYEQKAAQIRGLISEDGTGLNEHIEAALYAHSIGNNYLTKHHSKTDQGTPHDESKRNELEASLDFFRMALRILQPALDDKTAAGNHTLIAAAVQVYTDLARSYLYLGEEKKAKEWGERATNKLPILEQSEDPAVKEALNTIKAVNINVSLKDGTKTNGNIFSIVGSLRSEL